MQRQPAKTNDDMKSDARVSLSNFALIKVLGKGSFGKVGNKPCGLCDKLLQMTCLQIVYIFVTVVANLYHYFGA